MTRLSYMLLNKPVFLIHNKAFSKMSKINERDFFLNFSAGDLKYEFCMLNRCRAGIYRYHDVFLKNLCLEGWLLHASRIIESFQLKTTDEKWKIIWELISQHLSHATPVNRADHHPEKRENPKWDIDACHSELIDDLKKISEEYKSDYKHYNILIKILNNS